MCITLWQLFIFFELVQRSCVTLIAEEHWAGPHPFLSLSVTFLAMTFCLNLAIGGRRS